MKHPTFYHETEFLSILWEKFQYLLMIYESHTVFQPKICYVILSLAVFNYWARTNYIDPAEAVSDR